MTGCVFLADYAFPAREVVENVAIFGGISTILLLLSIFSYSCGRSSFGSDIGVHLKRSGVFYFLIALTLALAQFFLFYFGMKVVTHIPNYVALAVYALVSVFSLIKIIKATK